MKQRKQLHSHEVSRPWRDLAQRAIEQGWKIFLTSNSHLQWRPPSNKPIVITSCTPSDKRAVANALSHMRRAGLDQ